jgi:hypothetical protein
MTNSNFSGDPELKPGGAGKAGKAGDADAGVKDKVQQAAETTAEEGKHIAGVTRDEAQAVASEAMDQARMLLHEAKTQADQQSRTQRDRLVGTLQTLSTDLETMAVQGSDGLAADLARQAADQARRLSAHLDGREPNQLLEDVRGFARRRPGTFLFGAFAMGLLAGRLARGAKEANSDSTVSSPTGTSPAVHRTPGHMAESNLAAPGLPTQGRYGDPLAPDLPNEPVTTGSAVSGTSKTGDLG